MTTKHPDRLCGDSPSYWFVGLEQALRCGDQLRVRECRGHLIRLGVEVDFDIKVTLEIEARGRQEAQRGAIDNHLQHTRN